MEIVSQLSAAECLARVQGVLEEDEATNNLLLGLFLRLARAPQENQGERRPFFAFTEHDGDIPFVMLMTPPRHLIVYGQGEHLDEAIDAAVGFLLQEGISPPGVIGPREVATAFALSWQGRTGCVLNTRMEQMIYRLDRVDEIAYSPGMLIQATQEHVGLVSEWMVGFAEVTLEPVDKGHALEQAEKRISDANLYLWHDECPVSMAWKARPTRNGIVVSGVYTPPERRNRGYATSCVASLSQLLLDEGKKFCALYADLSNPTSNSIYQRIGYRPVQPSIVYGFDPPTAGGT